MKVNHFLDAGARYKPTYDQVRQQLITNDGTTMYLTQNAFHNCQMSTVGNFEAFLKITDPTSPYYNSSEEFIKLYKDFTGKPNFMIDIYQKHVPEVKKRFDNIILEAPYTNTSGSLMCIMIISTFPKKEKE